MAKDEMDITGNIKLIERLKSQLLTSVADLHENLLSNEKAQERADILANITILTYVLGNRLGISNQSLDAKINGKLKLGVLDTQNSLHSDLATLYKHYERRKKTK